MRLVKRWEAVVNEGMKTHSTSSYPERLSPHILPTAATMVGVCLTGIGLVKILERQSGPSMVDEYLAITSVLYCLSAALSYASIRWAGKRRAARFERIADYIFAVGMVLTSVICIVFAFDLA